MSEVRFKSASQDNMATGGMSVLYAHVHTGSYAGHGGVRCYASNCTMCIPKRLFEEGKCRRNTFSIFPLQGRSLHRDAQQHRHFFSQSGSVCNAKTWAVTNYSHGDITTSGKFCLTIWQEVRFENTIFACGMSLLELVLQLLPWHKNVMD